jgi:hypothetical protein
MTSATRSISISGGYNLGETSEFNNGVAGVLNIRYGLSPNLSANGKIGIVTSSNNDAFLVGELLVHSPLSRNIFMNIGGGGGFYSRSDASGGHFLSRRESVF